MNILPKNPDADNHCLHMFSAGGGEKGTYTHK